MYFATLSSKSPKTTVESVSEDEVTFLPLPYQFSNRRKLIKDCCNLIILEGPRYIYSTYLRISVTVNSHYGVYLKSDNCVGIRAVFRIQVVI